VQRGVQRMATKKTETVKARFQEAIARYKTLRDFDYVTPLLLGGAVSEVDRIRIQKSFAIQAVTFDPESDPFLKLAFEAADLDPQDPFAWKILLRLFAVAHFPSKRKTRGRKAEWTSERWCRLLSDYDQVRRENPNANDTKICEKIIKRFNARYGEIGAETVRRNLAHAKNPVRNTEIAEYAEAISEIIESEMYKRDLDFSVSEVKSRSVRHAINWFSEAWKRERKLAH
jgi:hypothetical protein